MHNASLAYLYVFGGFIKRIMLSILQIILDEIVEQNEDNEIKTKKIEQKEKWYT